MDASMGTRDLRELQRLMQIVTTPVRHAQEQGQLDQLLDMGRRE